MYQMESKHIVTLNKVQKYITDNILPQLQEVEVKTMNKAEVSEYIDALGSLDKVSKAIGEYISDAKKSLIFKSKELFGQSYKAKRSEAVKTEFNPYEVRKELTETDFLKCVKVVKTNLKVFLTKEKVKSLEKVVDTTERITFESLK